MLTVEMEADAICSPVGLHPGSIGYVGRFRKVKTGLPTAIEQAGDYICQG